MARAHRPVRQAGYALPAVLTVVTILTLIFMVCILSLENLRDETVATVRAAELERAAAMAEARFQFLAATEPLGANVLQIGGVRVKTADILGPSNAAAASPQQSVGEVTPLDLAGRPYVWREQQEEANAPAYVAAVQDLAGMINLDRIDHSAMLRLFRTLGVKDDVADSLVGEIEAYRHSIVDTDRGSAATPAVRPSAPNGLMRSFFEIYGVHDLQKNLTNGQRRRLIELTYVQPDTVNININTASAEALQTWYGISDIDAAQAIRRRETEIFTNPGQIGVAAADQFGAYVFPNGRFRFSFSSPGGSAVYRSFITLTPGSFERPFWVEDAHVQQTSQPQSKAINELKPFPGIPRPASDPRRGN